jgi:hypothetical protein
MKKHGLYLWRDENGDVMYIGSTSVGTLSKLEENHRFWKQKYGQAGHSHFRENLVTIGQNWTVEWAQLPREVSVEVIEIEEGALIRFVKPKYNKDKYPYKSSIKYNRYKELQ